MKFTLPQPLSNYDIFSYIMPGYLILVLLDYLTNKIGILQSALSIDKTILVLVISYIIGHLIDSFSGFFTDNIIMKILNRPQENLLNIDIKHNGIVKFFFKSYIAPFDTIMINKVTQKAKTTDPNTIFNQAFSEIKLNAEHKQRIDVQLNQYTFCRNICFIFFILCCFFFFTASLKFGLFFLCGTLLMLYRYLDFYKRYSYELFTTYSAIT